MTEIPTELINKTYDAFSAASASGKIRKGTNETTKAIERSKAILVAYAQDVSPPEIVAHLPIICKERGIQCISVPKKEELGKAAGLTVPTSAAAIVDAGEAKKAVDDLVSKLKALGGEKKAEKPAEKKEEAPKKEEPKEEKKEEAPKKEEKKEEVKEEKKEKPKPEKAEEKPKEEKKEEKKK